MPNKKERITKLPKEGCTHFTVRNIPIVLRRKVRSKAFEENLTMDKLIIRLFDTYLKMKP